MQNENLKNLYKAGLGFLIILSLFFVLKVLTEWKNYRASTMPMNSITVNGHGEILAVPDTASISFSVESSKSTQQASSNDINAKMAKILEFLKSSGIEEKDIKTQNYSSNPKYSASMPCPVYYPADGASTGFYPPCLPTESKIIGYTVSQNVTVKVRKVDDASKIIDGINKIGVMNMSGPNLAIDDEEVLKAQARKKAIEDAKTKAKALSQDLGVKLVRISSFYENSYNPYYEKAMYGDSMGSSVPSQIPKGEQTITADVSITYEIR